MEGSPAKRAALEDGDVVTHFDDQPIYEPDDLCRRVGSMDVGTTVALRIRRPNLFGSERSMTKKVTLSKKYIGSHRPIIASQKPPTWRGMRVDYATASPDFERQTRLGRVDPEGCVAVVHVDEDSPAWSAGVRAGMYLSHVNQQRVATPADFAAASKSTGEVQLRQVSIGDEHVISVSEPAIAPAP